LVDVDALPGAGAGILEYARRGRRILCDRRYAGTLAPMFDDPDEWLDRATAADSHKHDRTSTVVRVTLSGRSFHLKRYNTKNTWHALRRMFRRSRAMNCWTMARRFQAAGIPTATPAAMIQEKFGPLLLHSYFIAESVPGARLLDALRERPAGASALARHMSEIFRKLAENRLSHGDFKASNILVTGDGALCLLDLDAARHHRLAATHRRGWRKDRARLLRNFDADPALREIFEHAVSQSLLTDFENQRFVAARIGEHSHRL
jgi:tRNA A-37 threonylcarbamoyl transferase component Bud32